MYCNTIIYIYRFIQLFKIVHIHDCKYRTLPHCKQFIIVLFDLLKCLMRKANITDKEKIMFDLGLRLQIMYRHRESSPDLSLQS